MIPDPRCPWRPPSMFTRARESQMMDVRGEHEQITQQIRNKLAMGSASLGSL